MKIRRDAIDVKTQSSLIKTNGSWFYEDRNGISVYIYIEGKGAVSCRIPRRLLSDWIVRTEPKP